MTASLNSGTYGRQSTLTGALRHFVDNLLGSPAPDHSQGDYMSAATSFRTRVREANDVRELARSVEMHSPGFAADLYAAASRHEGLDD